LCDFLFFRPVGISLFSLLMATSSLSILYSITEERTLDLWCYIKSIENL
jgi:hypothetical protein